MPKTVLLIEDNVEQLERWTSEIQDDGYEVICADSIEKALEVFPQMQWDAVVVDGCIGGDDFNSPPLIREIKTKVKEGCPIIAATKNPDLATLMLEAGCTHAARKKDHVPGFVHSILRRP